MPPHHQHPVPVENSSYRRGLEPDNVMLQAVSVRQLHISERQTQPRAVIERPLSMDQPTPRLGHSIVQGRGWSL
jgi:hypothetical protein